MGQIGQIGQMGHIGAHIGHIGGIIICMASNGQSHLCMENAENAAASGGQQPAASRSMHVVLHITAVHILWYCSAVLECCTVHSKEKSDER